MKHLEMKWFKNLCQSLGFKVKKDDREDSSDPLWAYLKKKLTAHLGFIVEVIFF
jgi:hypothetical protein